MADVTHILNWADYPERFRLGLFKEWAEAGAEHLVLSGQLLGLCMTATANARKLKSQIREAGMTFLDAHALFGPWDDLCLPDESLRPIMLNRHRLALQACDLMEVRTCTIHVGNTSREYQNNDPETLIGYITQSLEELLPTAERYGVTICIENIWDPINGADALLRQIRHFNHSPWLGICYDAGHANLIANPVPDNRGAACYQWLKVAGLAHVEWDGQLLDKLLPHIVNCHLHDNHGVEDEHLLPGEGNIDWPTIMRKLAQAPRLQAIQNETLQHAKNYSFAEQVRCFNGLKALMTTP